MELSAFNNLQPSPEMLEIMWLKDDKSEEEEWYNDLNDFETNFFQNADNPYRDVQKGSRSKATVDLRSISRFFDAITTSYTQSSTCEQAQ